MKRKEKTPTQFSKDTSSTPHPTTKPTSLRDPPQIPRSPSSNPLRLPHELPRGDGWRRARHDVHVDGLLAAQELDARRDAEAEAAVELQVDRVAGLEVAGAVFHVGLCVRSIYVSCVVCGWVGVFFVDTDGWMGGIRKSQKKKILFFFPRTSGEDFQGLRFGLECSGVVLVW